MNKQISISKNSYKAKINMLSHWQIKLCESLAQAKGKELKQLLRFTRWYFRERLMGLVENANNEKNNIPYDDFYTAMYITFESEITECQMALKGKDKVWNSAGKLLSKEQLKKRIKIFEPLLQDCAMQLCEQCQGNSSVAVETIERTKNN